VFGRYPFEYRPSYPRHSRGFTLFSSASSPEYRHITFKYKPLPPPSKSFHPHPSLGVGRLYYQGIRSHADRISTLAFPYGRCATTGFSSCRIRFVIVTERHIPAYSFPKGRIRFLARSPAIMASFSWIFQILQATISIVL
jgi:hypothetical protein